MISVFGEPFSWRWFQLPEQVSSCATSLEDSHAVMFGEPFSWRWFQLPEQVSRDYFASCATSLEDSHAVIWKLRNNPPPPPPPESRQVVTVEERHALALDGDFDDDHEHDGREGCQAAKKKL